MCIEWNRRVPYIFSTVCLMKMVVLCSATAVCSRFFNVHIKKVSLLVSRWTYLTFGIDVLRTFSFDLMDDVRKMWDISVDLC